uniref:SufD family Fe-S cluster assembly protein n=1 Tax=Lactobacillus jensenii TaxID=109790 RepID=UPI002870766A
VLLIVDEGSSFSYIEKLSSEGNEKSKVNFVCEVIAKKNSHVLFTSIDNLAENVTSYLIRRGYLEKDAKVDWAMALMNDG